MHICIVKTHIVWLQKLCLTIKLTFWNNTFIIHNIITLVTPVILNISWFFLFIYLFSCIFININVASGHWVNKEKYFSCLHYHRYIHNDWYDSPYPIFALNARQSSNSFVLRDLYIFTNHCVTSTFILHWALLQHSTDIQFLFLEEKIVKQLGEWLQNHPLT